MNTTKTIQSALISVFSKEGLEPIVRKLHSQNVVLYSGGTEDFKKLRHSRNSLKMSLIPPSWAEE
jgi:AICAR transformylase/IMP cyclohydrolase PurH